MHTMRFTASFIKQRELNCTLNIFNYDVLKLNSVFGNEEWMLYFGFLIGMTQHLNDLNVERQDKGQFIHNLYDKIQGFELKLKLWKEHLLQNNVSHFPHLEKENVTTSQKYAQYTV